MGKIILIIVLVIAILIGGPLALIWAVNTLFPSVAIPYTIETWLAAFIVQAVLKSEVSMKK